MIAVLIAVCAVEATLVLGSLLPGEIVLVLAAGVAAPEYLPFVLLAAALGAFLGQMIGFWIGSRYGTRLRYSRLGRRLGEARWQRGESLMRDAGPVTMIAVRFVAVAHTLAPVAAGALGMERRRFTSLTAIASVAWAVVWVGVGVLTGLTGEAVDSSLLTTVLCVVGVVVAGFAVSRVAGRATAAAPAVSTVAA